MNFDGEWQRLPEQDIAALRSLGGTEATSRVNLMTSAHQACPLDAAGS
jgi:hypothetical protein